MVLNGNVSIASSSANTLGLLLWAVWFAAGGESQSLLRQRILSDLVTMCGLAQFMFVSIASSSANTLGLRNNLTAVTGYAYVSIASSSANTLGLHCFPPKSWQEIKSQSLLRQRILSDLVTVNWQYFEHLVSIASSSANTLGRLRSH